MVNSKKIILERYRTLLESNLILTDDLINWLKEKKVFPNFAFDDIKAIPTSPERNKKFLTIVIDNGDAAFTKFAEGLIANGQPFLGELLESEDKKASEIVGDASERVVIDDDILKKCPGMDKLRADTRDKLKTYLQELLLKAHLNDTWKAQNQNKSVEVINLKRQHYETQHRLNETLEEEKRNIITLKDALRNEQLARQQKEEEMQELRNEVTRLRSDFEQRWSSQIKMVDANNRSVFRMHDKMVMLTEWLRSLDKMLKTNILQSGIESDSMDQLQNKLKRYTTEIESLRGKGIGTDKLKEELYEAIYTSRYLPIEDRKNKPFHALLLQLYGTNQVAELATICTKDVLQSKQERDNAYEIKWRDEKIEGLTQTNKELNDEIERLKAALAEQSLKNTKPQWRPVPAQMPTTPRDPNKPRTTLKPANVQFGTKPGAS
ncbi:unnamed protein product [Rotaria sordida]|uniref:CARD domain-containing protein n=1 Tax=Rotaria sordida TaxID=392033 RepID=A0A815IFN0_9BILA|nr:unnamed protein product [Rotaria sordida]CAF1365329.1 unnamed protein product [Rotaria sordida]CAF3608476.1 unnamed protein product [Rotaria sordida]CAF3693087.1 unnamed protein product [Rotaria sordida]